MVANPFAEGTTVGNGRMTGLTSDADAEQNVYYRKCRIANLM
jgi:hypothetical protein